MFFSEYIRILQNHFKRSIGDNELCSFLFDFVIIPAELSNSKGDYLTVNKTQVSKLMNGISPVPKKIRDHIYDTKVIKELTNNFNQVIVPELNPEIGDLCFQMISIIENDNISPAHKADFEMLATPDTIGAFLAKVFIYVITTNGANGKIANENEGTRFENNSNIEPCLYIVGIKNNRVFNDAAFIEPFANCLTISKEKMLSDITRLYKKASAIKPKKLSPIENFGLGTLSFKPYVYPYDKQQLLLQMADILDVQLPEHFFKFGNLQKDTLYTPSLFSYTTERLDGNAEEIKKVEIMDSLYENIIRFIEIAPYIDSFENTKFISLALTNVGTDYDEDVRVTLFFNQYDLLTAEDIMNFDEETVSFILDKQDFEDSISIKKGIDFLAHFESNTHNTPNILEYHQELPFKKASKKQQCENIKIFLGYHYILDNDNYVVELVFDKINQNTSVAFPTVILLKNHISKINYIIKSKKNPVVYKGCINVS